MSIYSRRGKGWRYDFMLNGVRYTHAWYKTKKLAKQAAAERRKEVLEPPKETQMPTDMDFLELVNKRLDHVKAHNSEQHYAEYRSRAKRWVTHWGSLKCSQIMPQMIEDFVLKRSKVSNHTANKELTCLRATFNFGKKKKWLTSNPTEEIESLPEGKKKRYVPSPEDIEKVIAVADADTQDYLLVMRDTLARSIEINRLTWDDVNSGEKSVTLYTRKKKGGHLTPRIVPMTDRVYQILSRRFAKRDPTKPWVFWHRYWSRKAGRWVEGPYKERKRIMKTLCAKAGVPYFRFHPLRHSGASVMERNNVPVSSIQKLLGHESRLTTEIYLHSLGESEKEAMAIFERASQKFTHRFTHSSEYIN